MGSMFLAGPQLYAVPLVLSEKSQKGNIFFLPKFHAFFNSFTRSLVGKPPVRYPAREA